MQRSFSMAIRWRGIGGGIFSSRRAVAWDWFGWLHVRMNASMQSLFVVSTGYDAEESVMLCMVR